MKILLSLLFLLPLAPASGQTNISLTDKADSAGAVIDFLTGVWKDDSTNTVEFKMVQHEFVLLQPDYYTFHFLKPGSFPLDGVSMTWPPHGCLIYRKDENQIEIEYAIFGAKPVLVVYKRVKPFQPQTYYIE
jgi:hypothetical protein